jgi:hypothetical protein
VIPQDRLRCRARGTDGDQTRYPERHASQHGWDAAKQATKRVKGKGNGANKRSGGLLLENYISSPCPKIVAAVFLLLIPVLKPFWVKFSEGLADLAVRILELKARRHWPGLNDRTYEIVTKQAGPGEADSGEDKTKDSTRGICPPGDAESSGQAPPDCPGQDQHGRWGGWSAPQ